MDSRDSIKSRHNVTAGTRIVHFIACTTQLASQLTSNMKVL
jgi:hypothetical protein